MRLPRISPLYWEHLSRTTSKEFVLFGVLLVLFVVVVLFEPYNTEQPYSKETPEEVVRDHLSLSKRLGYATLLRAGYATIQVNADSEHGYLELEMTKHPELEYFEYYSESGIFKIDTIALTIAIVAAEKYNRPIFERRLESWIAELLLRAQGKLPEYTFGIAQIRPTIARRLLENEIGSTNKLSDSDLLALLMNDCQNIRLAKKYVEEICSNLGSGLSNDEMIAQVALKYNGADTPSIHGLRYVDAVLGAYHLLEYKLKYSSNQDDVKTELNENNPTHAFFFQIGSNTGFMEPIDDISDYKSEISQVHVYFRNFDPGPKAYNELLATKRKKWLLEKLLQMGYPQEDIVITMISNQEQVPEHLYGIVGEPGRPDSWAVIEVKLRNAKAYIKRGDSYLEKGQNGRAIADFNRALKMDPRNAEGHIHRGLAYLREGEIDKAREDLDKVKNLGTGLERSPQFKDFLKELSEASRGRK